MKTGDEQTAIVRVEQLYPLDAKGIAAELAPFDGAELVWVQDEPRNQGPWTFLSMHLPQALAELGETRPLRVVSRKASASPATGSSKRHAEQQAELIAAAFAR